MVALPPGITPKTVTVGIASFFDGTLADGTATITAPVNVVHTPSNRPIFSSQMSQRFVDGVATFNLCPNDAAGLNRVDWPYKLNVVISGALVQPDPIYFLLPSAGPDVVDLDGLVAVPSSSGTPISVDVLTTQDLPGVAAVTTAAGPLAVQKHNPVNAAGGAKTMTLPTGQPEGTQISVEKTDASGNAVTISGSVRGSAGTIALTYQRETLLLHADSAGSWWPVAGHRTRASLDAASLAVVGGQIGPTPNDKGALANGTDNDSAGFIAAFADTKASLVSLKPISPVGASTPAYLLSSTVDVPYTKSLRGDGFQSRIRIPANGGSFDGDIVFRLNTDATHGWVKTYPGLPATAVSGFVLHAAEAAAAGHNLTAFEFGGSPAFSELMFLGFDQGIRQIDQYCDLVKISRIYSFAKPDTPNYLIDLPYTGDSVDINQIHSSIDSALDYRVKLLRLRYKNGATIRNVINGDVLIEFSRAVVIETMHMESGQVQMSASSGRISDGLFYMRGRAGQKVTPVVVSQPAGQASAVSAVVTLSDLGFAYVTDLPGSYPTDGTPNFSVSGTGSTPSHQILIRNLHRVAGSSTASFLNNHAFGVTCGDAVFDAYSHFASVESQFANGIWRFSGRREAIPASGGIDNTTFSALDSFRTWQGASGTYYYRVVALYDTKRLLGRRGSAQATLSPVSGGPGVSLFVGLDWRQPGVMLRVYRGTASDSYDKFVDVPLISGARLHDSGLDIGGFPWVTRTAGPAITPNTDIDAGFEIDPGETGTGSDAYGRVIAYARTATAPPTLGGWRKGDRVLLVSPTVVGASRLLGWIRLTDCNSFAAAHVMGTDWAELRSPTS
jgi:hypothetical protein